MVRQRAKRSISRLTVGFVAGLLFYSSHPAALIATPQLIVKWTTKELVFNGRRHRGKPRVPGVVARRASPQNAVPRHPVWGLRRPVAGLTPGHPAWSDVAEHRHPCFLAV